eukprot:1349246-Prymnesium_polylepis.1
MPSTRRSPRLRERRTPSGLCAPCPPLAPQMARYPAPLVRPAGALAAAAARRLLSARGARLFTRLAAGRPRRRPRPHPVSYTHLTLPTICSV